MKNFTFEQHIKKHTKKENTYDKECAYCNHARTPLTPEQEKQMHEYNRR